MTDWRHYETALVADIFMDTRFLAFFFAILLLISMFIMNNSMSMTVFERIREFGAMRALGMSRNGLMALVSTESLLIGAAVALAGCAIGGLLCWYFGVYGIPTAVGELSSRLWAAAVAFLAFAFTDGFVGYGLWRKWEFARPAAAARLLGIPALIAGACVVAWWSAT